MVDLLTSLSSEDGQTVVLATHDHDVAAHAHRMVRMKDGRVVGDAVAASA